MQHRLLARGADPAAQHSHTAAEDERRDDRVLRLVAERTNRGPKPPRAAAELRAVVTVEDSGTDRHPPDPPADASGGYGLTGMRERAELLGGTLTAAPTPRGFRVELEVPR